MNALPVAHQTHRRWPAARRTLGLRFVRGDRQMIQGEHGLTDDDLRAWRPPRAATCRGGRLVRLGGQASNSPLLQRRRTTTSRPSRTRARSEGALAVPYGNDGNAVVGDLDALPAVRIAVAALRHLTAFKSRCRRALPPACAGRTSAIRPGTRPGRAPHRSRTAFAQPARSPLDQLTSVRAFCVGDWTDQVRAPYRRHRRPGHRAKPRGRRHGPPRDLCSPPPAQRRT